MLSTQMAGAKCVIRVLGTGYRENSWPYQLFSRPESSHGTTLRVIARFPNSADARRFVHAVIAAAVVHEASIELRLNSPVMRQVLLSADPRAQLEPLKTRTDNAHGQIINLVIECSPRRCGGEIKLVLAGVEDKPSRVSPSMVKAVARGHEWREGIVSGQESGGNDIAQRTKLDARYVRLIMRCAFLAPDIVERILDGRQPPSLTLRKVTSTTSMSWTEQRQQLGSADTNARMALAS
jgi:site-specific DNA recombinase